MDDTSVDALDEFTGHEMDMVVLAHVHAEREACARIAEEYADNLKPYFFDHLRNIAKAIRERGNGLSNR